MTVFDANTFGPDEVPVQVYEGIIGVGYTKCVLIDLTSDRQDLTYYIGWFDHDDYEWRFKDDSHRPISAKEAMVLGLRWSFLPLAIYDTNPELRKTVKI